MSWSPRSPLRHTLAACAVAASLGCGDDEGGGGAAVETEAAETTTDGDSSTGTAMTSSTGELDEPVPVVELRDDLCENPPEAAELEAFLQAALDDDDEPSYGERNPDQLQRMVDDPLAGPFYMVNLIRYREHAEYADGRDTDLTGEEANALYAPLEFLEAIGANVVFSGPVSETTLGDPGVWEDVAIVEYPCPLALFAMGADPEFQARAIHKDAGVEASIVMVTHRRALEDVGAVETPFPATPDDPSFEHVHVVRLRDQAVYDDASNEPERSGEEALSLYRQAIDAVGPTYGLLPQARLDVQGVFVGDGRAWDQVWVDFVPSGAAWSALQEDASVVDTRHHFEGAVEEAYGLSTQPNISAIPGAPEGGGGDSLPVTPDGTGTPCEVDADCPGDGVETCVNPDGTGGFCTREGCGSGECEEPYACCRDCSDAVAEFLPFEGSACMPTPLLSQLTQPPASCTCD